MQISVAPNSTASATRRLEVVLGHVVGVGRALALAEAAEGAADDADVGEVDVAVDDEGREVAGELGAQLVGGGAHRLDHLRPGLGEQRGQLVLASAPLPSGPFSIAARRELGIDPAISVRRPEPLRGMKLQYLSLTTSRTPCSIHSGSRYCG